MYILKAGTTQDSPKDWCRQYWTSLGSIIVRVICCSVTINSVWGVVLLLFIVVKLTSGDCTFILLAQWYVWNVNVIFTLTLCTYCFTCGVDIDKPGNRQLLHTASSSHIMPMISELFSRTYLGEDFSKFECTRCQIMFVGKNHKVLISFLLLLVKTLITTGSCNYHNNTFNIGHSISFTAVK